MIVAIARRDSRARLFAPLGIAYILAILASLAVALLIVLMTWTNRPAAIWLLVFVVGLATAPFFPLIVATTYAKFSPEVQGSVFGIIFAGALLGGATVPKAIGNLARGSSVQKSMRLLAPLCVVLVLLAVILGTI